MVGGQSNLNGKKDNGTVLATEKPFEIFNLGKKLSFYYIVPDLLEICQKIAEYALLG